MADESTVPERLLDPDTIGQIARVMRDHDLSEFDLHWGDARLRLRRGALGGTSTPVAPVSSPPIQAPPPSEPTNVKPVETASPLRVITSPIVGTFFTAANPNAEPFVRIGSRVEPESTVCIVEAMKVFNEIPAGVSGTIREILVENGSPVEYGQPLFRVAP